MLLQTDIGPSDVTIKVDTLIGLPTPPFTIVIDSGQDNEEICEVTAVDLATIELTATRGIESSVPSVHLTGAAVRHMATARDFAELFAGIEAADLAAALHNIATTNVHGIADASLLVTRDGIDTLTGKVISGEDNTLTDIPDAAIVELDGSKVAGQVDSAVDADSVGGVKVYAGADAPSHSGANYSAIWVS
jgi:hypothetical protein